MSTTFKNDYVTPPSTPRRLLNHEAYFPPRSHLVGLGLDFEFPTQSSIDGPEQCSAPRLGTSSPYSGSNTGEGEERCASYWSADSSVSTASRRLRRLRSESEIEEDEDDNGTSLASSRSTPSNFAYSPFAGAMSPSPRLSDASFFTEALGLGLSIHDNNAQVQVSPPQAIDNENDAWSRQSAWSFECLDSPGLPYEEERRNGNNFGFKPAPSYSYALKHTTFALLPSAHIPAKSIFPSSSSPPSIIPALSSSLLPLSDDLLQSSKVENATGDDPFSANYNAKEGERKRKRKESSIVGSPSTSNVREESEHVKRLKSSPALKHLGIFTHAALLEEREQTEKQSRFVDALSGLCVEHDSIHEESASLLLSAPQVPLVFEPTPELGSPSPSPSMCTVDCTLLVSSMPSESPYPPTPSSSAFAPFSYSSTIDSLASPSSTTFQEAVKKDICHKLSLSNMGLSVNDVNVFPTLSSPTYPRSSPLPGTSGSVRAKTPKREAISAGRRGMVVVVHTA